MKQPIFELKHRTSYNKMKEKIEWWIAYALPKRIAELAMIRICAHGTTGKYSDTAVNGVTAIEILDRWKTNNTEMTPNQGACDECQREKIPPIHNENNHEFVIGDKVEYTGHACSGFTGKIVLIDKNRMHIQADEDRCIYGFDFNPMNLRKL